jgi:26S proteasome non-ATPase regulatory subunit 9
MLSNDHKELTTQMEILLHRLHALSNDPGSATLSAAATADYGGAAHVDARPIADPLAVPSRSTHAFATIDEVAENSPAAASGLQVGDLMIRFAHVTLQTPNWLTAVSGALTAGEGKELEAVVLRDGQELKLKLTPQKWEGRGLLGCHLQPLR